MPSVTSLWSTWRQPCAPRHESVMPKSAKIWSVNLVESIAD
jgi:hypothetical protein